MIWSYISGAPSLFWDKYTLAGAYALRKLRTAYTGSCIRVRRAADSYEEDIGFSSNVIDNDRLTALTTAQNLLINSEDFTAGSWAKTAGAVTGDNTTAPDGTTTADKLTDGSAININQALTTTASQTYVFSCYLKKSGSVNNCDLYIFRIGTGFVSQATFNLNSGTIVSETFGTGATITSVGSGWYRCSVQGSHAGTSTSFGVYQSTEVFAWGAQVNTSTLKTYTKTTSSTIDSSSLFVTKWYDQSGNGYDLAQTTASQQPRIANNGTIDTEGGKTTIYFDGSNHVLSNGSIAVTQANTTYLATRYRTGNANCNAIDGITNRQAIYSDGSSNISFFAGTTQGSATAWGTSTFRLVTAMFNGASSVLRNNGSQILAANPGSNGLTGIDVGAFGGVSHWGGNISELLILDSDETSNFTAQEGNINGYYSIF
jgi:hypothetical protein